MSELWEGVVPSHGFSFSIEVNYNKGYFMNTKCMFSLVSPGYENKFILMSKSFRQHNPDYDIICFTSDPMNVGDVKTIDARHIDNQWNSFPPDYNMRERVWGYRCFATKYMLERYDRVLYCDSDIYFYGKLPDSDQTWFTLHRNHGYTSNAWNEYIHAGFINNGLYHCVPSDNLCKLLDDINGIHHKGRIDGVNARSGRLWDQSIWQYIPYLLPDQYIFNKHDGINVSYWNIDERPLSCREDALYAKDDPLVCVHYSCMNRPGWHHDKLLEELYNEYRSRL